MSDIFGMDRKKNESKSIKYVLVVRKKIINADTFSLVIKIIQWVVVVTAEKKNSFIEFILSRY